MPQLTERTTIVDLSGARRAVKRIRDLGQEADRELAQAEDQLARQSRDYDAMRARLSELGIKLVVENKEDPK